ncbi:hypothetical protein PRZ48_010536 [Zasmidium cellare]|uniref:Epoxide hydrolase N-terminal domain-containing protein n=1 Tax=Zasmidium cellare TaxID=395010 RepID=A0ABR0E8Y5_ZASCE|nr:hypothetical protein PRZ48_010536 [Zasmidium cellare]
MADYSRIPASATLNPQPFKAHIPEEKLKLMKDLIRLSPLAPEVFENAGTDRKMGIRRSWLASAQKIWLEDFDWRKTEEYINSFPNFTVDLKDSDGNEISLHFAALFSTREDAVPISMAHGWPGSFLEGLKVMEVLRERYSPEELPYHLIVPSLPGYAFSSIPPNVDYTVPLCASLFDTLMRGLGFESYIAQGGDVGTGIAMGQAGMSEACKGFHLNNSFGDPPEGEADPERGLDEVEKKGLRRGEEFLKTGMAYAHEHGTRPGTIGLVLQSSPVAGLIWIGEKYLEWTDEDPSVEKILQVASLYWLTDTYARCIYPYRALLSPDAWKRPPKIEKPFGYSFFPLDVLPKPGKWAAQSGDLVHYVRHDTGGHFPALEKPVELLEDIDAFVKKAWSVKK